MMRSMSVAFADPGEIEIEIDDATENYGGREQIETDGAHDFDDVTGDVYACCPVSDGGCLTLTEGCVTRCVYCKQVVAR